MKKEQLMVTDKSPTSSILRLTRDIHASMRKRFISKAQDMGYTMPQFMVMFEISSAGDMTMHELIGRLKLPKSTVSRIIDQLVEKNMLERTRLKDNRRVVMLKATQCYIKGKMAIKDLILVDLDSILSAKKAKKILESLNELMEAIKY